MFTGFAIFKNRWFRLLSIPFAIYFCTTWYYGWQYLYRLLLNEGTYSWKCDECTPEHPGWDASSGVCIPTKDSETGYICIEQENAVQSLYTMMSSMEFVGGIFAGLLYDLVGYRISLALGYSLHLIGIFCVCQSTKTVPLYYMGAICSGLAVNINAYPGYFIRSFFPKHGDTALLFMLSAQWAGSSIMTFVYQGVEAGGLSFRSAQIVFSCVGLPFVVCYYFVLPRDKPQLRDQLISEGFDIATDVRKVQLKDIVAAFKQWDIPTFAFAFYLPMVMANNAYMTCVAVLAGEETSLTMGTVQAYQVFVCLGLSALSILGSKYTVVEWFPYGLVMAGTFLGVLSLVAGSSNTSWTSGISVLFVIGNTYIYATKYVYAQKVIDEEIYGSVCGVISVATGVLQMTNLIWRSLAIDHLDLFIQVYCVIVVIACCIGIVLFIRVYKDKIPHLKYIVTPHPDTLKVNSMESGAKMEGKNEIELSSSSSASDAEFEKSVEA